MYLREETLRAANTTIVNHHFRHPLSKLWGGGTLSSSDGQRFPVGVQSRHARYFGFGRWLTFYTWTSDQFAQDGAQRLSTRGASAVGQSSAPIGDQRSPSAPA